MGLSNLSVFDALSGPAYDNQGNFLYDPSTGQGVGSTLSQEDWMAKQDQNKYADGMNGNANYDYSMYSQSMDNAKKELADYQLKQADPKAWANQKSQELVNNIYGAWTANNSNLAGGYMVPKWNQQLEDIKAVDPQAYYNAKIGMLANQAGWDAGQNKTNADTNAQIQTLAQEAVKAGIPADQISSLINTNYTGQAQGHAQRISQMDSGATLGGIEKVAPAFAAMITAGALAPVAAGIEAGSVAASAVPELAGGGFYAGGGTFAGEGLGTAAELAGPTYGELGITGVEGGFAGPTYGEMGYTGLNQQAAIDAANAASQNAALSDALRYGNQARQAIGLGSNIAKMVGGGNSSVATGGTTGGTTGTNLSKLASLLAVKNPYQPIELAQLQSKNPFLFTSPGQTQASQGMYDVSGSNLANALRKA